MPCKWRNRIITRCSSNVNVAISVSKTLLQLDLVTSIQRVVQCCHLVSPNLKYSHVSSNNFHVSICFHYREKIRIPYNLNDPHMSPYQRPTQYLVSNTKAYPSYKVSSAFRLLCCIVKAMSFVFQCNFRRLLRIRCFGGYNYIATTHKATETMAQTDQYISQI